MQTELLKRQLAFRGLSDEDQEEPDEEVEELKDDDDDLDVEAIEKPEADADEAGDGLMEE